MEVSTTSGIVSPAYTQDNSPTAETNYHASFMLNINDFGFVTNPGNQPEHHILLGRDAAGNRVFDVALVIYEFGTIALEAHVLDNNDMIGTLNSTEITQGPHAILIDWQAADSGSANGFFRLTFDGSVIDSVSVVNNDSDIIDSVRFGALPYDVTSASGSYYLDAFNSWREVQGQAIPTLNEWGMLILSLLMAGTAVIILRKNRSRSLIGL
jgi:hypothetical protein